MLHDSGFTNVVIGDPVDTFGGAKGEDNARAFEVYGYAFMARRPPETLGLAALAQHPSSGPASGPAHRQPHLQRPGSAHR
jgi:hypothetical protein